MPNTKPANGGAMPAGTTASTANMAQWPQLAAASGRTAQKGVKNVADILVTMMQDIHGGQWAAFIDHRADTSFVLIRPLSEKKISKPVRGESA